ncbi:MAG: 23S rRNA (guanosine(2251)-2'-O)-methyltransferase RlmB [Chitinophagaceae bacterium]|nr:MAG: 23S rRNA (guanosine(2251)-2'-O)-methyltransferase RlmB [Chitinophagaceae bacterium]
MLLAGRSAILEALSEGRALDRIYLQKTASTVLQGEIRKAAEKAGVPINYVPADKLNGFNVGEHGGCVALLSRVQYHDLQQMISFVVDNGEVPMFLILDGVTDIRNIGGIARTAWSMGVQALIIPDKGVGALNEDAVLTSAGALEQLPVCRVNSLMKAVDELRMNGIRVLASEMTAEKKTFDIAFNEPVAIVMGGEERGINSVLMKICDDRFSIPMPTGFESLNVSVATGMILYEAMKQRMKQ